MQVIELEGIIDNHHELRLQLPPQARAGRAKMIVLYEETGPSQTGGN